MPNLVKHTDNIERMKAQIAMRALLRSIPDDEKESYEVSVASACVLLQRDPSTLLEARNKRRDWESKSQPISPLDLAHPLHRQEAACLHGLRLARLHRQDRPRARLEGRRPRGRAQIPRRGGRGAGIPDLARSRRPQGAMAFRDSTGRAPTRSHISAACRRGRRGVRMADDSGVWPAVRRRGIARRELRGGAVHWRRGAQAEDDLASPWPGGSLDKAWRPHLSHDISRAQVVRAQIHQHGSANLWGELERIAPHGFLGHMADALAYGGGF